MDEVRSSFFGEFERFIGTDFSENLPHGRELVSIELGRVLSKGEIRHDIDYVFDGEHFRLLDPAAFGQLVEGAQHEIIVDYTRTFDDGSVTQHRHVFQVNGKDAAPAFNLASPHIEADEGVFSFLDFGFTFIDAAPVPNDYHLRVVGGLDAGLVGQRPIGFNGPENNFEFFVLPDFENPHDADANNIYDVQLALFDGSVQVSDPVAASVTVVDVPASPLPNHGASYGAVLSDLASQVEIPIKDVLPNDEAQYTFVDVTWQATSSLIFSNIVDVTNTVNMSVSGRSLILNIDQQEIDDLAVQIPIEVAFQAKISDGFGNEPTAFGAIVIIPADDAVVFEPPQLQLQGSQVFHVEGIAQVDIEADLFFGNWEKVFPLGGLLASFPDLEVVGGADAHLFRQPQTFSSTQFFVGERGDLIFRDAPDFNNPMDANGDNVYEVDLAFRNELVSSQAATLFIEVVSFDPADNANPALMVGDVLPIVPGTYESIEFML